MMTKAAILAARTPAGGYTKETLERWGIMWPPAKGWIDFLANNSSTPVPDDELAALKAVRDDALKSLPVLATMCRKIGLTQGEEIALQMLERAKAAK